MTLDFGFFLLLLLLRREEDYNDKQDEEDDEGDDDDVKKGRTNVETRTVMSGTTGQSHGAGGESLM